MVGRTREEIPKQGSFVDNLINYNSAQWIEFFQMTASTTQKLVEELGPFFCQRDGEVNPFERVRERMQFSFVCRNTDELTLCLLQEEEGVLFICKIRF